MLRLYVDESGSKSFADPNGDHFLVCGLIFDTFHSTYIRHYANYVKKKHFGVADNKVFHANEIFKKYVKGLKTNKTDFYNDLLFFLKEAQFEAIIAYVHKPSYKKKGYREENVHRDAYQSLFKAYFRRILTRAKTSRFNRGQICLEQASIGGDIEIHKIYSGILSGKWQNFGFGANIVRKYIVSLKYVTKHNHDTEVQVADILAYAFAKSLSNNYSHAEQKKVLEKIVELAKTRKFMFTDFETSKRRSSFIDIS